MKLVCCVGMQRKQGIICSLTVIFPGKSGRRFCYFVVNQGWFLPGEKRFKGKSLNSTILRIAWNAVVYFTWIERNKRIYQGKEGTLMQVLEQIKEVVRIRLIGLKHVKLDSINFSLYSSRNLTHSIFE